MKIKNQVNSSIITAAVAMLQAFVPDLTPTRLVAALQSYKIDKDVTDARPMKPYTVAEVSQLLGVSKPTIYKMFRDGVLTRLKIMNSTRIPAHEIHNLIAGGKEDI